MSSSSEKPESQSQACAARPVVGCAACNTALPYDAAIKCYGAARLVRAQGEAGSAGAVCKVVPELYACSEKCRPAVQAKITPEAAPAERAS